MTTQKTKPKRGPGRPRKIQRTESVVKYEITPEGEIALNTGFGIGTLTSYTRPSRERLIKLLKIYQDIEEGAVRRPKVRKRDLNVLRRLGFIKTRRKELKIMAEEDLGL